MSVAKKTEMCVCMWHSEGPSKAPSEGPCKAPSEGPSKSTSEGLSKAPSEGLRAFVKLLQKRHATYIHTYTFWSFFLQIWGCFTRAGALQSPYKAPIVRGFVKALGPLQSSNREGLPLTYTHMYILVFFPTDMGVLH